jgi:hypothetical protein
MWDKLCKYPSQPFNLFKIVSHIASDETSNRNSKVERGSLPTNTGERQRIYSEVVHSTSSDLPTEYQS